MENLFELCIILLSWFIGGIVGGATGMGSVMVAMPLLTTVVEPGIAILVSCIVSLYAAGHQTVSYGRYVSWSDMPPMMIGMVPGCLLGVLLLMVASVQLLSLMVGLFIFCFVALQLNKKIANWQLSASKPIAAIAGGLFGFGSAAVAMGGPPLAIYVILRHWEPNQARGNMSLLWFVTSAVVCVMQLFAGMYTWAIFQIGLIGIVGTALGQCVGVCLGRRIDLVFLRRILLIFLTISAILLLRKAFL
jgi:uncharacterized membrane protein YfcA